MRIIALDISSQMLLRALFTTVNVTGSRSGGRPAPSVVAAEPRSAFGTAIRRLPSSRIVTVLPGGTSVVESISSMIAGPSIRAWAGSSGRR